MSRNLAGSLLDDPFLLDSHIYPLLENNPYLPDNKFKLDNSGITLVNNTHILMVNSILNTPFKGSSMQGSQHNLVVIKFRLATNKFQVSQVSLVTRFQLATNKF